MMSSFSYPFDPEKPFSCSICQKQFTSKKGKEDHVARIHENSGHIKCDQCDRTFLYQTELKIHQRSHTGERPFSCEICQKRFASKTSKDEHMHVIHENTGRFKCSHCNRTFERKSTLEKHEITHTQEWPFPCETCKQRFRSKCQLRKHHLDVHAEKKFECEHCGKTFGRQLMLKHHLIIHSEDRPYKCDICAKSFKYKQVLKKHHISFHSIIQQNVTGQRSMLSFLVKKKDPKKLGEKVEQPDSNRAPGSGQYSLRMRRKMPNYKVSDEEPDEPEESDRGSMADEDESGSDEEGGPEETTVGQDEAVERDETVGQDDERPTKKVKTENRVPSEEDEISGSDVPVGGCQVKIKREPGADYQPGDSESCGYVSKLKLVDLDYKVPTD